MHFDFLIFSVGPSLLSREHRENGPYGNSHSTFRCYSIRISSCSRWSSSSPREITSKKESFEKMVLRWSNFSFLALAKRSSRNSRCDSSSPREITFFPPNSISIDFRPTNRCRGKRTSDSSSPYRITAHTVFTSHT